MYFYHGGYKIMEWTLSTSPTVNAAPPTVNVYSRSRVY